MEAVSKGWLLFFVNTRPPNPLPRTLGGNPKGGTKINNLAI